jgi:hypothetical protein
MTRASPTFVVIALGNLLVGCAAPANDALTADAETAPACALEAERLLRPVTVLSAPDLSASPAVELDAGTFVYRCGRRDAWARIMYPAPDQPVDCSARKADRTCPTGWVYGEVETEVFG